ncbi:MAG: ribosomal protein S7, small subunit ribosomal protein S7 [Parcubacteria group bacterium GW2011_GWC1_36_108]|nr:MAG: ribosomal protein S7, small subunit ribosomal protein S7 [Parcubacteria group bacterium GW2011_GWC1_36_108]MDD5464212.1 30S ribosomal protein S7 [Candidatus Moranbacteria bacterium]HAR99987.1 30S ribosomal protein S7 [Candidatus Moranbacteria bacterium]HBI50675.1 30S ribosomal protein S7 [Candidatus Moranbacteria bacterium]HBU10524.1 30S ribosomal protein S7 [Candidatus Moranbacteria bacterium]
MARRKRTFVKQWKPDSRYGNILVGRFIGNVMQDGKRSVAERVIYDCFDVIHERTKKGGLNVFEQAIKNISPLLELKSKRIGGANYQVPIQVSGERRQTLAVRWILTACRAKKGKRMAEKLADELIDGSNKVGSAMKKRDDTHRMAEANKAFAHFA